MMKEMLHSIWLEMQDALKSLKKFYQINKLFFTSYKQNSIVKGLIAFLILSFIFTAPISQVILGILGGIIGGFLAILVVVLYDRINDEE